MNRRLLEGYAFAALFLIAQLVVLTLAFLGLLPIDTKPLWLHPGLAVAAGFAAAGLRQLARALRHRDRRGSVPEESP